MNVKIAKASAKDLDVCVSIGKVKEFSYLYKCTKKEAREYLKEFLKTGIFLIAKCNEEVVGFILAEFVVGKFVWVDGIVVKIEFRNLGIGKLLFKKMESVCKAKGFKNVFLVVPKFNKNSMKFYKSLKMRKGNECIELYKKIA